MRWAPAFVLGQGAVSPFGIGVDALLAGIFGGQTGIAARRRTAAFEAPTAVAAELPAATLATLGGDDDLAFRGAMAAAGQALAATAIPRQRIGLVLASTKGDLGGVLLDDPGDGLGLPGRLAGRLRRELGLGIALGAISCACASGLVAVAHAARHLQAGTCDHALVVGVDVHHPFVMAGFGSLHALDPTACRPFDVARRGVVLGEAAAALLLGRSPMGPSAPRLLGHGGANDACHITGPDRQGAGLALASQRAIATAGLTPQDIDVIHLHGTGTLANDATEAIGLANLFSGRTPPAFGTKGQTGHTLGASGVLELLVSIAALQRALAPSNVGLEQPDVTAGLDLVRSPRPLPRARHALKVASGFGGAQAATVVAP
ncbi:MAG: beta-ketoacyl-[acyl-carrier-protein] synthase family protein [Planctomycetes bacterium]|nr:beta-ketoacyl-[acyl-carrier-protein] synthase family protein [Planctomycetota bacterium]